ncbi:penicillin-binding protein 1A [Desulfohalovibrio reitneri]|uniref:penicillin-binding protein 1A n=1 Tax=Desulfohalovibrio reitneri TaxID=1307759 RepID=UPI0004A6BCE5|nr:PBP1A family penicillin-binding protein [Desulfohalovibrio reitneri]
MKRFLIGAAIALSILLLVGLGSAVGLYFWASQDLPNIKRIEDYKPPLVTTVRTEEDEVLGHFYREKRWLVTLDQIPEYLPKAFLAAEDAAFYEHEGVDLQAIFRAAMRNMAAGEIKQGGSTITQQVIKRLLLTPERSYKRKLKEAILAYRLERFLSKDDILTIYLNQIYLGAGAYGVEAAARIYFGTHVEELSLAQSAMLAGLPQLPSRYNPYRHWDAAKRRQDYVLGQMLDKGWISQEQYNEAQAEEIVLDSMPDPSWGDGAYYLEEVRRWLIDRFGEDTVYEGGLRVTVACDLEHQKAAEESLRDGLVASTHRRGWKGPIDHLEPEGYGDFLTGEKAPDELPEKGDWLQVLVTSVDKSGAKADFGNATAAISVESMHWCREPNLDKATDEVPAIKDARKVVEPGDVIWAEVVAPPEEEGGLWKLDIQQKPEVQGALVSVEPGSGKILALVGGYSFAESQFNRATQAERQPGSAFKPIVYSAALDNGFTPASILLDAPIVYTDYETDETWKPENFEEVFHGPTLLRTALVKSRNLVTIRVAQKLGIDTIIKRAKTLGLESDFKHNLSVALGSSEVTLLNLSQAYTTFARGGTYVKPRAVLEVKSAWGEELYTSEKEVEEAISPQTAYIMASLMQDVVKYGTGWRAKQLKRPVAGKTGTTNEERDAWFMGYTPYLLSGVYVGFDDHRPMGKWETGSRAASSIWADYRLKIEGDYEPRDFPQPDGVTMVRIDAENGLLAGTQTQEQFFLPFKSGTEPTEVSTGGSSMESAKSKGEDLLKQVF